MAGSVSLASAQIQSHRPESGEPPRGEVEQLACPREEFRAGETRGAGNVTRETRTASQVGSLPPAGKGILAETPWMEEEWLYSF